MRRIIFMMAVFLLISPVLHAEEAQKGDDAAHQSKSAKASDTAAAPEGDKGTLSEPATQEELQQLDEKADKVVEAQKKSAHQSKHAKVNKAAPAAPEDDKGKSSEPVTQEQLQQLNEKVDKVVEAQKKTLLSEFNPSIGLVGETIFSYNSRPSNQTGSDRPGGFDVFQRSVELNLAASVDPFVKGYAVINATADAATTTASLEVEEAAAQTTSLPWNLELKGGRFFGEFGRLSYIHDHELPFVNRPLVLDQYIGGESQTDGIQLNWLLPIKHYVSLTLGVGDKFGDDQNNPGTFRHFDELNFWGRLSTYFDMTPNWQLEMGVSGLYNPKAQDRGGVLVQPNGSTQTEHERRVAGFDLKLSYVPLQNNQFRSFTWGTEVLYSRNRYLFDPDGSLNPANPTGTAGWPALSGDEFTRSVGAVGLYSYVVYKWHRQWSAGFLFDWLENAQNNNARTVAYSPFITWAISHWNQLRLQYTRTNPDAATGYKSDNGVFVQWAWIIGSHSHGWQQR